MALVLAASAAGALAGTGEAAEEQVRAAKECTTVVPRAQRLACFDEVFDTRVIAVETVNRPSGRVDPSPYWEGLMNQASKGDQAEAAFQIRRSDHEAGEPQTVVVTTRNATPNGPATVMAVSCRDNITRLELALARPVSADRVTVNLSAGEHRDGVHWRVRDNGWMVHAGRGLPAIDILRAWLDASAVQLSSRNRVLDGLRFDLSELDEALKPLRRACSW